MESEPSREEKQRQLFLRQKQTLELFLERRAISQAQYDKSYGDLKEKMGVDDNGYPVGDRPGKEQA